MRIFTKYLPTNKLIVIKTIVFWDVTPWRLVIWTHQSFRETYCFYLQGDSIFRIYYGAVRSFETTANTCTFKRRRIPEEAALKCYGHVNLKLTTYWWEGRRKCSKKTGIHANLSMQHTEVTDKLRNPQAKQGMIVKWVAGTGLRVMKMWTGKYCLRTDAYRMTLWLSSFIKTCCTTR